LNTVPLQHLIFSSQRTRGAKYLPPILVTRLCRNYLPDEEFSGYDRAFGASESITSAYNSCLHSVWTPTILSEDVPADSSSEEQLEEEDEPDFWCQPPPTYTHSFMFIIWKGMRKIFRGQTRLRRQMECKSPRGDE